MSESPTITAAIITRDEEQALRELLAELDWVDQIVVVDGGSCDETIRIAKAHGCRVVSRSLDTFARQRNYALQLATSEWVLSIDTDERPTPRLIAEIRRQIGHGRDAGYRIPIQSRIFGRHVRRSGTQDDCPVRLARRREARWVGDVHEVLRVAGPVGRLKSRLNHRTLPDLDEFLTKMNRYTALEARSRVAAGCPPRRYQRWITPGREVFRRLFWKQGFLDGPAGWAFCLLSGLSEWVLAGRHRQLWEAAVADAAAGIAPAVPARCSPGFVNSSMSGAAGAEPLRPSTTPPATEPPAVSPPRGASRRVTELAPLDVINRLP